MIGFFFIEMLRFVKIRRKNILMFLIVVYFLQKCYDLKYCKLINLLKQCEIFFMSFLKVGIDYKKYNIY